MMKSIEISSQELLGLAIDCSSLGGFPSSHFIEVYMGQLATPSPSGWLSPLPRGAAQVGDGASRATAGWSVATWSVASVVDLTIPGGPELSAG